MLETLCMKWTQASVWSLVSGFEPLYGLALVLPGIPCVFVRSVINQNSSPTLKTFFFFFGVGGLLRYSDFVNKIWHRPAIGCYSVIWLLSLHSSLILPFSSVLYYQFGLIVCPHPFTRWSPLVEDMQWLSFPP